MPNLVYHDPFVPELNGKLNLTSVNFETALDADTAVIVTAHPNIDYNAILERVPIVMDLRGHTRKIQQRV